MSHPALLKSIEEGVTLLGHEKDIRSELAQNPKSIVVLDDDPTGTQTVYDVPVITEWTEEILENELLKSPVFFILTNSRSLQVDKADALGELIGSRLQKLAKKHQKKLLIISRSDSTLRGHYPNEVDALVKGMGLSKIKHILAPAFFEGGRYTYDDVHYVKEGNEFVPAAKTPFAADNTFGYSASNLKDWIVEKSEGRVNKSQIASVSVQTLRNATSEEIKSIIEQPKTTHIIANATCYADLQVLALAILKSKDALVFRTAASFVNAISGIALKPCLTKNEILKNTSSNGALVVIGSYVPKTTAQLAYLKERSNAFFLELDVTHISNIEDFCNELVQLVQKANDYLKTGEDVVVFTSRKVIKGATKKESLEIVNRVSNALISFVKKVRVRPKYILAKGGITSSDVATKGLNVRRANVMGQVLKGVPVWQLGNEAKFPDMPYIVFPGNVGDETALHELISLLK
ncbi:four-carbon acid sugar kinase family protein [uncultured Zobellia sp.]|uniref:four-carbon acid sugar kinase family protein n=1 Tax=uncultured Zobellia sp. TaxID=255433 RepID=UPI00259A52B0|nr:four-carbon acid sugar kinase family protein [uncultured Zobellia sp.]